MILAFSGSNEEEDLTRDDDNTMKINNNIPKKRTSSGDSAAGQGRPVAPNNNKEDSLNPADMSSMSICFHQDHSINCHITNLFLSDNEIGDDGAILLAEFLQFIIP